MKFLKFFLPVLFVLITLFALSQNASAQTPTQQTDPQPVAQYKLNTNPDVPQNFHTYTQSVFIEMLASTSCLLTGFDPLAKDGKCLGIDPITRKIGYETESSQGLLGVTGNLIGATFNIPISSTQYGRYIASNFGITKTSYAQGFGKGVGFVGLTPVLEIWKTFRNITYVLFVIVFIVLGLGIMFRFNIDARTVMTIQSQIPKIIIALILITFSYAIVGFFIDMMYVAMYLVIHFFTANNLTTITNIDTNPINAISGFGGINAIAEPAANSVGNVLSSIFDGNLGGGVGKFITKIIGSVMVGSAGASIGKMVGGIAGLSIGIAGIATVLSGGVAAPALVAAIVAAGGTTAGGATMGSIIGGATGAGVGFAAAGSILKFVAFLLAYLIITIALLQALFRTWFTLIKAYVFLILNVIFAPFWILAGILPGAGTGFSSWLRSVLANLAAFPVVLILFLIGKSIMEQTNPSAPNFIPPLIGDIGSESVAGMAALISMGIILIMPEALTMTKKALKAPDLGYTQAVAGAIAGSQGIVTKPIKGAFGGVFGTDQLGRPKAGTRWVQDRWGRGLATLVGGHTFGSEEEAARQAARGTRWFGRARGQQQPGGNQQGEQQPGGQGEGQQQGRMRRFFGTAPRGGILGFAGRRTRGGGQQQGPQGGNQPPGDQPAGDQGGGDQNPPDNQPGGNPPAGG